MTKIEFVYFDVGGVLINDFSGNNKRDEWMDDLGYGALQRAEFRRLWDEHVAPRVNLDYDVEDFCEIVRKNGLPLPDEYSMLHHGFVNRFEANKVLWPLLEEIDTDRCGLLTNMYPRMLRAIKHAKILPPVVSTWNENYIIDSSVVMAEKPNSDIFKIAEAKVGLKPEQILFVDNTLANIEAAQAEGWQTFQYDPTDSLTSTGALRKLLQSHSVWIKPKI